MEISNVNSSKMQMIATQTVVPTKQTEPRRTIKVLAPGDTFRVISQRHFQVVMLYDALDEGSGWDVAGWMKESLSWALAEESIFAGRLRRGEDGGHDDVHDDPSSFEVVANDSGARLVEATMAMELEEFLDHLKQNTGAETELSFWENIHEQNPQFFPLVYVQVTNFKCGGFSIGVSWSPMVTDPVSMISFLKKWSEIHHKVVSGSHAPKSPLFSLTNVKPNNKSYLSPTLKSSTNAGKTVIFNACAKNLDNYKDLARVCIHEAEKMLIGKREASSVTYSILLQESSGSVKVEKIIISSNDDDEKKSIISTLNNGLVSTISWENYLEIEKVHFSESSKPRKVLCWVNSVCDEEEEGLVMIFPSSEEGVGFSITVTLPR